MMTGSMSDLPTVEARSDGQEERAADTSKNTQVHQVTIKVDEGRADEVSGNNEPVGGPRAQEPRPQWHDLGEGAQKDTGEPQRQRPELILRPGRGK